MLILWGDDFSHQHADKTYANLAEVIKQIGADSRGKNYNLQWSSIERYMNSVREDARVHDLEFETVKNDFWAYNPYS